MLLGALVTQVGIDIHLNKVKIDVSITTCCSSKLTEFAYNFCIMFYFSFWKRTRYLVMYDNWNAAIFSVYISVLYCFLLKCNMILNCIENFIFSLVLKIPSFVYNNFDCLLIIFCYIVYATQSICIVFFLKQLIFTIMTNQINAQESMNLKLRWNLRYHYMYFSDLI